jgi:hypothetical protein
MPIVHKTACNSAWLGINRASTHFPTAAAAFVERYQRASTVDFNACLDQPYESPAPELQARAALSDDP